MSRQVTLETRACSIMIDRGLDGLKAWISSLSDTDQQLLDGWLVDEKPEPELQLFDKCENPDCEAEQVIFRSMCWSCGWTKETA